MLPFLAKKVIPTLGLAAASGAIQGATNKVLQYMKPLTNSEIDKIMTKYDNYRGTFSKNMLPKTMKKNEAHVVNL